MGLIERLDWDSEHIHPNMWACGSPTLEAVNAAKAEGAERLQWRGRADHDITVEALNLGFRMVDDMLRMQRTLHDFESLASSYLACKPVAIHPFDAVRMLDQMTFPYSRVGARAYQRYLEPITTNHILSVPSKLGLSNTGIAAWSEQGSLASLDLFFILPEHQRKGMGLTLLSEALQSMKDAGFEIAETTTWLQERAALALYRKAGFQAVERLQTWWLSL